MLPEAGGKWHRSGDLQLMLRWPTCRHRPVCVCVCEGGLPLLYGFHVFTDGVGTCGLCGNPEVVWGTWEWWGNPVACVGICGWCGDLAVAGKPVDCVGNLGFVKTCRYGNL